MLCICLLKTWTKLPWCIPVRQKPCIDLLLLSYLLNGELEMVSVADEYIFLLKGKTILKEIPMLHLPSTDT